MDGTALEDHRIFDTPTTTGATVFVTIKKDATNLLGWEATLINAATDDITRVTELTAIGTISNSNAVEVTTIDPSVAVKSGYEIGRSIITYIVPSDTDTYTTAWTAGQAWVDGEVLDYAAANTGNLAQGGARLSATGVWYRYLYDNAGAPTIELSQTASVKEGDTSRRWIGYHWIWNNTGTREIGAFYVSG